MIDRVEQLPTGSALGTSATVVQFSSAFCQPCRATRRVIESAVDDLAPTIPGVEFIEIDADDNLAITRAWAIESTPTVVFLDSEGREAYRASGQPRKADVIAALGRIVAG